MRPIIALLGEVNDERCITMQDTYVSAVEETGGISLIVPCLRGDSAIDDVVELCDGFLFTGGHDVHPSRYGEAVKDTCGGVQLFRDELEFRTLEKVIRTKKPILAICRGIQLLNVFFGGTLHQDMPSELDTTILHKQVEGYYATSHEVNIVENTPLYELIGSTRMKANSFHHQAIRDLGRGLLVSARAGDGIIEGVYTEGEQYIRAYQWHPERLVFNSEDNRRIIEDFINACIAARDEK